MAEYIDREAAILKMKVNTAVAVAGNPTDVGFYAFIKGFQKLFTEELYECKTADVAEVVRCIDCKHLMFSDCYGECSRGYMGIVSPDDFCSRGERKDGERK